MRASRLSPLENLADAQVLLLGTTGFLAKVMLSLLLERFSPRRLYCLVRPTRSLSAADRFWDEVMGSELFEPLKSRFGPSLDAILDKQVEVVAGDIGKPELGLDEATARRLREGLDLIVNSAGLVAFNPPLDQALESNALGAHRVAQFCRSCAHAKLVHVSTCFVAGAQSGRIPEEPEVLGWYPKKAREDLGPFDWAREVSDLQRCIRQVRERTDDAALEARFRQEARERLRREGRDAQPRTVKAAITNQRRRWVTDELIRLGQARAEHWGWPNIYTYSKALGEQALASVDGLQWAVVRPAIVESAMSYPFPGWNEGMNTSAPLALLGREGQLIFPGSTDLILDVVPVDYVASATLAAAAALQQGEHHKVYQVAAGDVNPCSMARTVHLVGIYRRRLVRERKARGERLPWVARLEEFVRPVPRDRQTYQRFGAPAWKKWVSKARSALDDLEPDRLGSMGEVVHRARKAAQEVESELAKVVDVFDLFMPFIWENKYVFRTAQTRDLFARMSPADRALLPFDTENIDWRHYWLDVHLPGLEKWVFPKLKEDGRERVPVSRDYRDLSELFDSRTREHARRAAFRIVHRGDVADSFTYRDLRKAALTVQGFLQERGIGRGDRVILASEGRPEWGICYFGILLSGATAVPLDVDLSPDEKRNIVSAAGAKGIIASPAEVQKLVRPTGTSTFNGSRAARTNGHTHRADLPAPVWTFDDLFLEERVVDIDAPLALNRKPEDIASIIFTSGTTGRPKAVVLTDRNFTALTARMSALFDLRRSDALLSVLPPHHTFEFSAGLLMPLASGASITYLEERSPELLQRAFRETPVTAMIGVPAVWESLYRKIQSHIDDSPLLVRWALKLLARGNRLLRERSGINVGRVLFRPIHNAFGGRVRYMVSGGAPLRPRIFNELLGYGFGIHEGYGLTEASPVLTVGWPRHRFPAGSVGWPLPGIEVRIDAPDEHGIGEVIARGPTIMQGYLDEPDATREALRDGWLHTGDRGRIDEKGRLYIVGRDKDVIIDRSGKNVYPDEVEQLYAGEPFVQELSVLGLPSEDHTGERVVAVVVPDYQKAEEKGLTRAAVRESVEQHFREVGSKLPFARRVKRVYFQDGALPRTSTRKVRRTDLRRDLQRRLAANASAGLSDEPPRPLGPSETLGGHSPGKEPNWAAAAPVSERVRHVIGKVAQTSQVLMEHRLVDQLGFDSLLLADLLTALEAEFSNQTIAPELLNGAETVEDVVRLIGGRQAAGANDAEVGSEEEAPPLHVPEPLARLGKRILGHAQHVAYDGFLNCTVEGRGNIPANRCFIVASNHCSHLDMGLVKYALGPFGRGLRSLAAKDYFFDDPVRRAYFENFTNLLPIERHGSFRKSLRLASRALSHGQSLLIFPEGTRSRDGVIASFKPAIGYLCLHDGVDVLPVFLGGTHEALPAGSYFLRPRIKLFARIGAPLEAAAMREQTQHMRRAQAYRHVSQLVETEVRKLGGLLDESPKVVRTLESDSRAREPTP
ncbi:MAG: AMP-binding protein [Myxococcota bacterium]